MKSSQKCGIIISRAGIRVKLEINIDVGKLGDTIRYGTTAGLQQIMQ
jgi:hypothetical protein